MIGFSPAKKTRKKPKRGQLLVRNVKRRFKRIDTLNSAVDLIEEAGLIHSHYFHYTTVGSVKEMIENRRWWLTRADSLMFDDLIEAAKYGSKDARRNIYFGCFTFQRAESAAMWGLYGQKSDRTPIRVSLPGAVLKRWLKDLEKSDSGVKIRRIYNGKVCENGIVSCEDVKMHDVLYAAVRRNQSERRRAQSICWNDSFRGIADLEKMRESPCSSGVLKDYEWRFEYESRLRVRVPSGSCAKCQRIALDIPAYVLEKMKFTRSPWVRGVSDYPDGDIRKVLRESVPGIVLNKKGLFQKSVLTRGLKKWDRGCQNGSKGNASKDASQRSGQVENKRGK